jgi:hypothetical protein
MRDAAYAAFSALDNFKELLRMEPDSGATASATSAARTGSAGSGRTTDVSCG